jgi:hypothetical protein
MRVLDRPIIHINPLGKVANRMLQYMAVLGLQECVPGSIISNVRLSQWGITLKSFEFFEDRDTMTIHRHRTDEFDIRILKELLITREVSVIIIDDYLQNISFYPNPDRYRNLFRPKPEEIVDIPVFNEKELVINIRTDEILDGMSHYPLVPVAFYQDLIENTGLKPVIMGQLEPSFYLDRLTHAFPKARYIASQGAIRDFTMIRSAIHIAPAVSTFSWLAAYLSCAQSIHLPLLGFYNPSMLRQIDLLPLDDPRFVYYIFPLAFGMAERETLQYHDHLGRAWQHVPTSQLAFIKTNSPFLRRSDATQPNVDPVWYAHTYLDAAREISEGWYDSPQHHFELIGVRRGYLRQPPPSVVADPVELPSFSGENLALRRPALQSSISRWSRGNSIETDAAGAVDGDISEIYHFHTAEEDGPWWQVDLGNSALIQCVKVYNRIDQGGILKARAVPLTILVSDDGHNWKFVYRHPGNKVFGGADGHPLQWRPEGETRARYVRLQATQRTCLHLNQVQVFGSFT